jgi:hypothetical protein
MLTIELIVVFLDKSDFHFAYESYVFRVTFLMAWLVILLGIKEYNVREYVMTVVLMVVAVITYRSSGRNDMIRFLAFIAACKGLDITEDPGYWTNTEVETYYGIESITGVERANWTEY